ncbi:hypothetical protein ACEPAF_1323 [Sanghuangporus sanghuang]
MPSSTTLMSRRRSISAFSAIASASTLSLAFFPLANAFSFNIDNLPQQCSNMSISITGTGGVPPYSVLIIPFGGTPLPNNIEARRILDQSFDGDSTTVSFQLKYPALSQFVAVVSDSQNFGSGGTSSAATAADSSDSSCFDASQNVQADFFFNTVPLNQFVQCEESRIWWDPSTVQGQPTFYGVIPGGDSFNITVGDLTTVSEQGVGFNWTPNIRGGTTLVVGAGDDRGLGAGGSVTYIVSTGNGNTTCLDNSSPSSTAGSPAGGSYPTSTSEAENSRTDNDSSNTGAIAGGVVAGVVVVCAFVLVLLFLRRRKRQNLSTKERPDLFTDNEHPSDAQREIARLAPPEPYIVPSEPARSEWGSGSSAHETGTGAPVSSYGYGVGTGAAGAGGGDRRTSAFSLSTGTEGEFLMRPGTPQTAATSAAGTNVSRKGPAPVLRPVNIIQHEDAGTTVGDDQEPETVELPPAYTNIRRD